MKMTEQAFVEMLKTQYKVNQEINQKLEHKPGASDYVVAFNVELFEFINTVGIWKWWKHSHKIDRVRVLDELADCYAFMLSALLTIPEEIKKDDVLETPRLEMIRGLIGIYNETLKTVTSENIGPLDIIYMLGTASELEGEKHINFLNAFAAANAIAEMVLENLEWEEVVAAYEKKSGVNIARQEQNY